VGTCATGYKTEAGFDMEWAKNFSIWTRPPVKCPRVTNDALEALDRQYRCDGCGRPEASMATRMGHQRHCPYLLLIDTWENPEDSDGEWAVEQILDVRGPPERRFWKLLWAPYTDEEHDVRVQARRTTADDGSWRHGWQTLAEK
jgi:hypothetical protein